MTDEVKAALLVSVGVGISAIGGPFIQISWMKAIADQVAQHGSSDALGFQALLVFLMGWGVGAVIGGVIAMMGTPNNQWTTFNAVALLAPIGSILAWLTGIAA